MHFRSHHVLGSVLLALALSAPQLACVPYPAVPVGPRPNDRVVEICHQSVRAQASERYGRSTHVGFDTPESYYVSSALQGVRGGGVIGIGGDRARIHYDCAVNIRSGRSVRVELREIDEVRRRSEWSIDACQNRIRQQADSDQGRRTTLDFGPAETWFISLDREGVRGEGRLQSGSRREPIRYECEVDIRRGRIDAAHYRSAERLPMTDAEALQLCQGQIADEVKGDRGGRAKLSFGRNEVYAISKFEKGVRGRAVLKSGKDRDGIAYECTVDTRRERVSAAHYRPLESQRASSQRIVELCQLVTREMAAADHGRGAAVEFDGAEVFAISERETGVRGGGLLRIRGERDPIRYECTVDHRKQKVTDARYRPVEPPAESARQALDLCHAELREQIAAERKGRVSLEFESPETFFVSHAVEGVRGEGVVRAGRRDRDRDRIRYECEVDIRRGRVVEARYRYR